MILDNILKPYKKNCCYLRSAKLEITLPEESSLSGMKTLFLIHGNFSISNSCYIDDTGHFNAVEFNICLNQLGYYFLAECFQHKLLEELPDWNMETYYANQLSNVLIAKLDISFFRMMQANKF